VQAQVALSTARKTLAEATLRAPIAGVVAAVNGVVGTQVSGGGSALASSSSSSASGSSTGASSSGFVTLANLTGMQLVASFAETDAVKLRVGQPATVTVDALPSRELAATVVQISPTAASSSSGVVTYDVTFSLAKSPAALKPGMTANVDVIAAEQDDVLDVPTSAVTGTGSSATVTVLGANGKQTAVPVATGLTGDSTTAIVGGNLKAGDRVVLPTISIAASTASATGTGTGRLGGGLGGFGGGAFRVGG